MGPRDFPACWRIVRGEVSLATSQVGSAAAGDQQAFMGLIEPELPGAYRLAVGMLRNAEEAEDAVQEAALRAWRGFARFAAKRPSGRGSSPSSPTSAAAGGGAAGGR